MKDEGRVIRDSGRWFDDVVVVRCARPETCAQSRVLLARVGPSGLFELLTAGAWARALGYVAEELIGKSLRELLHLDRFAASEVIAALLDENDDRPLDVTLRCKDRKRKSFRLHRRFDPYGQTMFLVADELACAGEQSARAPAAYHASDAKSHKRSDGPQVDLARQPLGQL